MQFIDIISNGLFPSNVQIWLHSRKCFSFTFLALFCKVKDFVAFLDLDDQIT